MLKHLAFTALLAAVCVGTATAGVHFLPGATSDHAVLARPSRTLPAWELPEGLLVIDRRTGDGPELGGEVLEPRFTDGEWYLVDRDHARADPAAFGQVHLASEKAWLVEVPPERNGAFFGAGFDLQYLERAPLAVAPPVAKDAPAAPAVVDPELKAAYLDALDQDTYNLLLRQISGDTPFWYDGDFNTVTTRYYNTAGNWLVAEYLADKLAGYGYTVELDDFTVFGHPCRNVVATLPGSVNPDEIVVVGGHFDSTSQQADTLAPGAEDNGSGTGLVMELARVSAGRPFERTVQFVLFDAEEVGLRGSQHFVDEAVSQGRDIVAAITADMVSYYDANYGVIIEGQTAWEWLMTAMSDNVDAYTDIAYEKTYHSWGSDHVPFQQAGIAAFLAIDQDWDVYPHYHETTDAWANVAATVRIALQISRAAAGTLADVAGLMGASTGTPQINVPVVRLDAYPNPFNPLTTLRFSLDRPTRGELVIHDLRGRVVRRLTAGDFLAGEHEATWTGADDAGRAMPSGVYVARLRTDGGVVSQKLNLVR